VFDDDHFVVDAGNALLFFDLFSGAHGLWFVHHGFVVHLALGQKGLAV
jgi:hypothetical protein